MELWKRNLYIIWATQILSLTGFGFVLPFLPYYIQELGVHGDAQIKFWTGFLSSGPALTMGIMAPIWGIIADRFGRKLMILRAMFAGAIIMALMSRAGNVYAVAALRLSQGLFTGTVTAAATLVASTTPEKHMSYALGFLSSSTFIGFSLGPLVGGVVAELLGYRASFLIGAMILVIGFFSVLFIAKEIHTFDKKETKKIRLKEILNPTTLFIFILIFLLRFIRVLPVPFIPLFIQDIRGTIVGTAAIMGVVSASRGGITALSGMTLPRLGDKHNRINLIILFFFLGGIGTVPIFFTSKLIGFTILLLISAYFLGGIEPILQSSLSRKTPQAHRGIVFGVQTTIANIGWFIAPLIGSAITISFSIQHAFLFVGIFTICITTVVVFFFKKRVYL